MRYSIRRSVFLPSMALLLLAGYGSAQTMKAGTKYCVEKFGQREFDLILKDISDDSKKKLTADAELRKKQVDSLKQLFAFACEAEKRGLANDETNAAELENIRSQITAVSYDKLANKTPGASPFSNITDSQIVEFYKIPANVVAFDQFLKSKTDLLHRGDPRSIDRPLTDDDRAAAKDFFVRIKISESASEQKKASLGPDFAALTRLQSMLQQAQFLAGTLSDKMAAEMSASDSEVTDYIRSRPEFDVSGKKALAAEVLAKAKAGEDFAALANKYSEDPGNAGPTGEKNGGLYKAVRKGTMVAPFENAALSLQPGAVYPDLVESDFGFHIIKLESKVGDAGDLKYDVRHILISTMMKDPTDPNAREMPIKDFVRAKIEDEKGSTTIAKIVAENPVAIGDFVVSKATTAKNTAARPATRKPGVRKPAVRKRH
ncbi:MAG TPA: peptidylprolyl isomerase [Pyrinomonadaceae bacterium]